MNCKTVNREKPKTDGENFWIFHSCAHLQPPLKQPFPLMKIKVILMRIP